MQKAMSFGPWPSLGYVQSAVDRAALRRIDPQFLDACAAQETCGFYLVGGEMVVLQRAGDGFDPLFSARNMPDFATAPRRVFLGMVGNAGRFALSLHHDIVETLKSDDRFHVTDLRSMAVQGLVGADHLAALAEAKALLHWHARRHFCSNCGHPTEVVQAGWRRDCSHCGAQHFPRTDPVVIMLAVKGEQCLLGRQSRFVPGMWSCLAGFVEPGETIEEAARRETLEEAGIRCGTVRYFASQPWPFPSSLMIGCHAEAISHDIVVDQDELEDARWFSRDEAAAMLMRTHPEGFGTPPPMAIAYHIIRAWVERGDGVFA
jgi:NAD+ diphosphatase